MDNHENNGCCTLIITRDLSNNVHHTAFYTSLEIGPYYVIKGKTLHKTKHTKSCRKSSMLVPTLVIKTTLLRQFVS